MLRPGEAVYRPMAAPGSVAALVDLETAKRWVRVDGDGENADIERLVHAAGELVAEHLGQPVIQSDWEARLRCWPLSLLPIWLAGPVQFGVTITLAYTPSPGAAEVVMPPADYTIFAPVHTGSRFSVRHSSRWPSIAATGVELPIRIAYQRGYPADSIPAPIIQAVSMLVAEWYDNRASASDLRRYAVPDGVLRLLAPYCWRQC